MATGVVNKFLQDHAEFDAFLELLRQEDVRSYLEVGAWFGGSLRRVAISLPPGSRVVAVDLPNVANSTGLADAVAELRKQDRDAHLICGDSTSPEVVDQVRALGPFDAVFIDGNHKLPYVTQDWENYGSMGRIVAFHDIAWRRAPEWSGARIEVPEFWESIKVNYRHNEFKLCHTGKNNGIGVLWR